MNIDDRIEITNPDDIRALRYLATAIDKHEIKDLVTNIHVSDNGRAYSTNRHLALSCFVSSVAPGSYRVVSNRKKLVALAPSGYTLTGFERRVFTDAIGESKNTVPVGRFHWSPPEGNTTGNPSALWSLIVMLSEHCPEGYRFSPVYLSLICAPGGNLEFSMDPTIPQLKITGEFFSAALQGMRL